MKLVNSWTSESLEDSVSIAKELSRIFKTGDVVLMQGTLGSGKTFLVQEISKNWNITEAVTSPTFTLVQIYSGDRTVNHLDLYRIEDNNELDQLGWEELVFSDATTFIEWPERLESMMDRFYKIEISHENNKRVIRLLEN